MRRIQGWTSSKLFEIFASEKAVLGLTFLRKGGTFVPRVGQITEETIKQHFEYHFKPKQNDDFKMELD